MRARTALLRLTASALLIAPALPAVASANAASWELDLDLRAVTSDASTSVLDDGYSPTRFSEGQSGLQLGRLRLALNAPLGEVWTLHLDASAWGNAYKSPIGLTEAYLQFRPYPRNTFRIRMKAGAFYAPISLENGAAGWSSPYTLSFSALNSWLAEELRTLGLETKVDWLGTRTGLPFDVGAVAGVFGWNEVAGAALADGGFILDDRQTPLFDSVGKLEGPTGARVEPFRQIDGHAGYYGGMDLQYPGRLLITALRYDNRADPSASDAASHVFAWRTSFNSAGARMEYGAGWTVIAQWLAGETEIAPGGRTLDWPFNARYVLLSRRIASRHALSIRYDRFAVESRNAEADGQQSGHAWTAAYLFDPGKGWRVTLEWLRVTSSSYSGSEDLALPGPVTDTQVQLSIRYALGSTSY
ncbi:MAG TPA: hypothetical protein VHV80_12465 [Steroidobacteraceae bacterium]|jgi:hypothetical protein|nr:hypothetical protein [Steroidobacteraceae bacterium]